MDNQGKLSYQQKRILRHIARYTDKYSVPPSYRDVAASVGIASPSTVSYYIKGLEAAGLVERRRTPDGKLMARCLVLTESGREVVGIPTELQATLLDNEVFGREER